MIMKQNKLKLTVFFAMAMTIALSGGYWERINLHNFEETVYAAESIPSIQCIYLEKTGEIKAGNTIYFKINMDAKNKQFNGVYLQFKFDSSVFENIEVTPGDICTNSENTFVGKVRTEQERINIYFADTTGENKQLINEDGSFAVIALKVKDDYNGEGSTDLSLKSGFASDINEKEFDINIEERETIIEEDKDSEEDNDDEDIKQDKEDVSDIKIDIRENNQNTSNMITPTFIITNNGKEEFNLSNLKFNYYYTKDNSAVISETFNCYYSGTINGNYKAFTSNVVGTLFSLSDDKKTDTADSYMQIGFNGGILDAGQSMIMQTAINKSDWSNYDLNNDYSYNNADNISIYVNDKLVNINKN